MKIFSIKLALTLCLLIVTVTISAQSTFLKEDTDAFVTLKEISIAFFNAVQQRDSVGMSNVLAKEFTLTSSESNGELMGRTGYVRGSLNPDILKVVSFRLYDFKIRTYDDMAIVQSRIDWKSEYFGQPWNADFLISDIFVYRDSRWQIVHRHSSYPANYLEKAVEMRTR
ncbi:MAG: nuclear transport factor 2 family protein [Cyclobacteriaceae bacterium]